MWARRHDGAAAVEFALIFPLLLLFLAGVIIYGSYFWTAHAVQQVANDAARAAMAGLNPTEQLTLAQNVVAAETTSYAPIDPRRMTTSVSSQGAVLSVRLAYDSSDLPIWSLRQLVPTPSPLIQRSASVAMGGY